MNTYVQDFVEHVIAIRPYLNCFKKKFLASCKIWAIHNLLIQTIYSRNKHDILKVFSLETIIHVLKIIHGL